MLKGLNILIILVFTTFFAFGQNVSNQGNSGGDAKSKSEKSFKQPASQLSLDDSDKKMVDNKKYQQKVASKSSGYSGMSRRYAELYEKKFWIRTGIGYMEAWNPNKSNFKWNNSMVLTPIAIEYKAGVFTIGAHLHLASMNSDVLKSAEDTIYKSSKENFVGVSLVSKVYFRGAGYKFNPYGMMGLSYLMVNRSIERYDDNRVLFTDNESETLAGFVCKLGMDYMFLDFLGVNLNAGWGLTYFDFGLIFKL